jgi:hypothetical protein
MFLFCVVLEYRFGVLCHLGYVILSILEITCSAG